MRAVRAAIADHGPITFAEYMELALYGPGGYYERAPVGSSGDFVTSPHVHPVFGEFLATAVRELFGLLERPDPFEIVDVGAGDGTLARQLIEGMHDISMRYTALEVSTAGRTELATVPGLRVADELEGEPHVVIAHELLDNLPFRVLRDGRELRVGSDGSRLVEVYTEPDNDLRAFADGTGEAIVPIGALGFIDRVATVVRRGYVVCIDYGGVGTSGGEVHGYREHRVIEDVLASPGETDITVGVDFAAIAHHAERAGLNAFPTSTQHDVLMRLGFEGWTRDQLARQRYLLDARDGVSAVGLWSGRSRATLLADPAALGRMRWLVLASPELPAPSWLSDDGRS